MTVIWIIPGVFIFLLIAAVILYNRLVFWRNQVKNGWSQIQVQLKRRYNLVPNLIETVKGYAKHEQETLSKVAEARSFAMHTKNPHESAKAETLLGGALKSLFALSESYPDLKANQNFLQLQEEIASTENKISFARQFYNDTVTTYNTRTQSIPHNILAGIFNFKPEELFEIERIEENQPVSVKF